MRRIPIAGTRMGPPERTGSPLVDHQDLAMSLEKQGALQKGGRASRVVAVARHAARRTDQESELAWVAESVEMNQARTLSTRKEMSMATTKQRQTARRNVKKAQAGAQRT